MDEIETQYTYNIVCPYCGYIDHDSCTYEHDYDHNHKCENCGKIFSWCRDTLYCSGKIEQEEPDMQEKIDADARKNTCDYFNSMDGCGTYSQVYLDSVVECGIIQHLELLKRQREFDARK